MPMRDAISAPYALRDGSTRAPCTFRSRLFSVWPCRQRKMRAHPGVTGGRSVRHCRLGTASRLLLVGGCCCRSVVTMLVSAAWQTLSPRRMGGLVRAAADAALVRKLRLVALVALLHLLSLVDIICTLSLFALGERFPHECSVVDVGDQAYATTHTGSRKKMMIMKADMLSGSACRIRCIFSCGGRDTGRVGRA